MCVEAVRRMTRAIGPLLVAVSAVVGCAGGDRDAARAPRVDPGPGVVFSFAATDGSELGSATTRGRVTILLFLTTYDNASQLMARQLRSLVHRRRPRINVGAVVLETSKYAVLAPVFRQSLELDYPVAMADEATLQGQGSFGPLRRVPTLVILDRRGRRVWQEEGYVPPERIEAVLDGIHDLPE